MGCSGSKKAAAEEVIKPPTTAEKTETASGKVPHAVSPHTLEALYTVNKHKLGEGAYGVVKDGQAKEDGEHVKKALPDLAISGTNTFINRYIIQS